VKDAVPVLDVGVVAGNHRRGNCNWEAGGDAAAFGNREVERDSAGDLDVDPRRIERVSFGTMSPGFENSRTAGCRQLARDRSG
jgi:hypothetical protein